MQVTNILLLIVVSVQLLAQSPQVERVQLTIEPVDTNLVGVDFSKDSIRVNAIINLSQTTGISKINVRLGNRIGENNLIKRDFVFDQTSNLPAEMSYRREGNVVYLCLGKFYGFSNVYVEVDVKDSSNKLSPTKNSWVIVK